MADNMTGKKPDKKADKKKLNIFQKIKRRFTEVRQELKRVIWPTREKLIQVSAVVLAIILAFAVFLTLISTGGRALLERVGFYEEVEVTNPTDPVDTVPEVTAEPTEDPAEETEPQDDEAGAGETADEETTDGEATAEETAAEETTAAE